MVIIEGLHALNPALTERLPADAAPVPVRGSAGGVCRPDSTAAWPQGHPPGPPLWCGTVCSAATAPPLRWACGAKVCAGEDQYIKPFKPRADLLLDTTHTYEVCLWHALLDTMPPDEDLTATQRRQFDTLRARFAAFPPLDTALVPADSMLREFIGA